MEFLFPMVVEERTLAAADAWLADDHEGPASLRRLVSEGRDGIARALWARKRDAAAADQGRPFERQRPRTRRVLGR